VKLLELRRLTVEFGGGSVPLRALDGVDLVMEPGEVVGLVGESGSGKSVLALAVMGLIEPPGLVRAEVLRFAGQDLLTLSPAARRRLLGKGMAMIFQDPTTSLNPCYTVGFQLLETIKIHNGGNRSRRRQRALELLEQVGIPDPTSRLQAFPHQLSGGLCQRVMIALALAGHPKLLIADEPTTALDVTIQAQILELLRELQRQRGMGLLLITHDLALVAENCQRVVVLYAGQVVEMGSVDEVFASPRHPYTAALLAALPERNTGGERLATIPGVVPGAYDRPDGCLLHPRCEFAGERCRLQRPELREVGGRWVRCHRPLSEPPIDAD
jgi:dipeptide transport system ATP-binding protein